METISPIHGIEMEWSIVVPTSPNKSALKGSARVPATDIDQIHPSAKRRKIQPHGGKSIRPDVFGPLVNQFLGDAPRARSMAGFFLSNGGEYHFDVGDHYETSTGEHDSFNDSCASEIGNENLMYSILAYDVQKEILTDFSLNKRVIADGGETWGFHESYYGETRRLKIEEAELTLLGLHMATRNLLFGAGVLMPDGNYYVSQKMQDIDIEREYSTATTRHKPLVNLRTEPLADKERFIRIHLTACDPAMSPWVMRVGRGSTSLVVRAIQYGYHDRAVEHMQDLGKLAQRVGRDITAREAYKLPSGTLETAGKLQDRLIAIAHLMDNDGLLSAEDQWNLEEWEKANADMQQRPGLLADRSDWVVRLGMLERMHEKQGLDWEEFRTTTKGSAI